MIKSENGIVKIEGRAIDLMAETCSVVKGIYESIPSDQRDHAKVSFMCGIEHAFELVDGEKKSENESKGEEKITVTAKEFCDAYGEAMCEVEKKKPLAKMFNDEVVMIGALIAERLFDGEEEKEDNSDD